MLTYASRFGQLPKILPSHETSFSPPSTSGKAGRRRTKLSGDITFGFLAWVRVDARNGAWCSVLGQVQNLAASERGAVLITLLPSLTAPF